jgi:hypothetical protein
VHFIGYVVIGVTGMSEVQGVGVAVRELVRYQSVSMYVATDRVKSGVRFNIRPQAGCIRAFWCAMVGIIAHIYLHYERYVSSTAVNFKHEEGTKIFQ